MNSRADECVIPMPILHGGNEMELQDSPVGVGFSYTDHPRALAKTDAQVASDMFGVIKLLLKELASLPSSPLYLVGESYGGKTAAMVGVLLARAIQDRTIDITLGGKHIYPSQLILISLIILKKETAQRAQYSTRMTYICVHQSPTGVGIGDGWISPGDFSVNDIAHDF